MEMEMEIEMGVEMEMVTYLGMLNLLLVDPKLFRKCLIVCIGFQ